MDIMGNNGKPSKGGTVIDLVQPQISARFAPLQQIEGYWNALRGSRQMPFRSEIDPRGLKGTLEYCFVLERVAPGIARLRVAGSHLGDLMGMEVRGMPISSYLTSDSRQVFAEMLEEVFELPATATLTLSSEAGFGRNPLTARMILMPVRSDLGDTSRILGGFMCDGEIGRAPRRFEIDHIDINPIDSKDHSAAPKTYQLSEPRHTQAATAAAGMAEDASQFEQAIPGVPYLRLVK